MSLTFNDIKEIAQKATGHQVLYTIRYVDTISCSHDDTSLVQGGEYVLAVYLKCANKHHYFIKMVDGRLVGPLHCPNCQN